METINLGPRSQLRSVSSRPQIRRCTKDINNINIKSGGDEVAKSRLRAAHSRRKIRLDKMGRPSIITRERLRGPVTPPTKPKPTNHPPRHGPQHCSIRFLPHLPLQRQIPNPHRPTTTNAARALLQPNEQRSLVRIPQPPARLARLHRVPPLFITTRRHKQMEAMDIPCVEEEQSYDHEFTTRKQT